MEVPMGSPKIRPGLSRKATDPLFLCMVGAMILAVASSVALRAMVAGAGPAAAGASEIDLNSHGYLPPSHHPATRKH
jgi:hypothetical protein